MNGDDGYQSIVKRLDTSDSTTYCSLAILSLIRRALAKTSTERRHVLHEAGNVYTFTR